MLPRSPMPQFGKGFCWRSASCAQDRRRGKERADTMQQEALGGLCLAPGVPPLPLPPLSQQRPRCQQ
eukprot:15447614-Alexandrium_andersonii.AAC.1